MEIHSVSIGPVDFDRERQEVTLQPGLYRLSSRIVFGIVADTEIKNFEYDGFSADVDPNGTVFNSHAGNNQASDVSADRIGAEEYAIG